MEIHDHVKFYKLHGSGNDFIIIPMEKNKLNLNTNEMSHWAKKLCTRKFSVGADGLIFLTKKGLSVDNASYKWHFYNSDGSRAEMCGNGSRCAARLAYELDYAPEEHIFETDAGPIYAHVYPGQHLVRVQLTKPFDLNMNISLDIDNKNYIVHFVNSGVPHTVVFDENVEELDVKLLGKKIRFHKRFAPKGTNVNFVKVKGKNSLYLRTYERGVEDETYACGTGAAASAYIAYKKGLVKDTEVSVTTSGGEELIITIKDNTLYLTGGATLVYQGILNSKEIFSSKF